MILSHDKQVAITRYALFFCAAFFTVYYVMSIAQWVFGVNVVIMVLLAAYFFGFTAIFTAKTGDTLLMIAGSVILILVEWGRAVYQTRLYTLGTYNVILTLILFPIGVFIKNGVLPRRCERWLLNLLWVVTAVTILTTMIGLLSYPTIARDLASAGEDTQDIIRISGTQNIGGFSFVYLIPLLYPAAILQINQSRLVSKLLWKLLVTGSVLSLLIMAKYSIALIVFLVEVFLLFVVRSRRSAKWFLVITAGCLLVIFLAREPISELLFRLAKTDIDRTYSQRLLFLGNLLNGKLTSDYEGFIRVTAYGDATLAFLRHPLLGSVAAGEYISIDSFVLSFCANFGVLGLALVILYYTLYYRMFVCPCSGTGSYPYALLVFATGLLFSTLNRGMWEPMFFLVFPLAFPARRKGLLS